MTNTMVDAEHLEVPTPPEWDLKRPGPESAVQLAAPREVKPNGEEADSSTTDPASEVQDVHAPATERLRVPDEPSGYRYPGRNFNWWDALALTTVQGTYLVIEHTQDAPDGVSWSLEVPFDRSFRDWIVAGTRERRERADRFSDYFWYGSNVYPFAATLIIPLVRGSNLNAPLQMSLVNLQAMAATTLIVRMPHKWIGRLRPNSLGCAEDDEYSEKCGSSNQLASFPSGHTQVAMTGAGLSCAHHIHGKLLGHPVADALVCGAAVAAGGSVGYFRMRGDRHWLSDTIIGAALGFGIGYGIPTLFYYHPFWEKGAAKDRNTGFSIMPIVTSNGGGVTVVGVMD